MTTLTQTKTIEQDAIPAKCKRWMKRIGVLGGLFFLIKGLLWILIPWMLVYFGAN